tara:strand:- start:194 stop:472 length:279 start_codon:yes stop_codon:yes gene_type:complete
MAKYTESQAKACTIVKVDKLLKDDVFVRWFIEVVDEDGEKLVFVDESLSSDASASAIKGSILAKLQEEEKRSPEPVSLYVASDKVSKGETVG